MERSKQLAISFFRQLGYSVTDIPEATVRRADLDVNDGISQYIVEVKEKLDTGSQIQRTEINDGDSTHVIGRESHSRSNRLDGVLKHGKKQLNETPCEPEAFNLIYLVAGGANADMTIRRALYTFYGVATLIPVAQAGNGVNCVYFDFSTAFATQRQWPACNGE